MLMEKKKFKKKKQKNLKLKKKKKMKKKITCLLNAFNNCILIGDKGGNIVQYQNENNEYKKLSILKKAHFYFIKSLIFLKNGMIVSLSESTAKIWDY